MKRFEQSVRVITTLFAALLGFGLKTLLDQTVPGKESYQSWALPAFLISLLLFTSFLIGSANFLWWKFVLPDSGAKPSFVMSVSTLVREFAFIMLLGVIGIKICYARSWNQFLFWQSAFGLCAATFCFIYIFVDRGTTWKPWLWCSFNIVHFLLPLSLLYYAFKPAGPWHRIADALMSSLQSARLDCWSVAAVYAIIFLCDAGYQFHVLRAIGMPLVGQHLALARRLRDAGVTDIEEAKRHCDLILQLNPTAAEQAEVTAILDSIR